MAKSIEQLEAEVAALQRELREERISKLPPDQRPIFQQQQQLEMERTEVRAERERLNEAARRMHAEHIVNVSGLKLEKLLEYKTLAEMDAYAFDTLSRSLSDPKVRDELERLFPRVAATGDAGKTGDKTAGAAGADAAPSGAKTGAGTAQLSDTGKAEEITKKYKGTGDIAGYLAEMRRETPFETVNVYGQETVTPSPEIIQQQADKAASAVEPAKA